MDNIEYLLKSNPNKFTVFVFSNSFSNSFGKDYLRKYIDTEHFINTNEKMVFNINKVFSVIEKSITAVKTLVDFMSDLSNKTPITILKNPEVIINIVKLFTVQEHKAAKLVNISPIIISAKDIDKRYIKKFINIFQDSVLKPTIIIADDKDVMEESGYSLFPEHTVIKYIHSSLKSTEYTVLDPGVENTSDFINSFSDRCFNSCANTENKVLFSEFKQKDEIITNYTNPILRIHTNLLQDKKENVKDEIDSLINDLSSIEYNEKTEICRKLYLCILLICRVFCRDNGKKDMQEALALANELNNDVLKAHVFRYADFLPVSKTEKEEMFNQSVKIFSTFSMPDHSIYAENNKLVDQFFTNYVDTDQFKNNSVTAQEQAPGMCGMAHILNNTGVAFLYNGKYSEAIEYFNDGLLYSSSQSRIVQYLALLTNRIIARKCMLETIAEDELLLLSNQINDGMENRLSFISARYQMNLVSIAFSQNPDFGKELLFKNNIAKNTNDCIKNNKTGSTQLQLQLEFLSKYNNFPIEMFYKQRINYAIGGKREVFITQKGVNPFHFKTWL